MSHFFLRDIVTRLYPSVSIWTSYSLGLQNFLCKSPSQWSTGPIFISSEMEPPPKNSWVFRLSCFCFFFLSFLDHPIKGCTKSEISDFFLPGSLFILFSYFIDSLAAFLFMHCLCFKSSTEVEKSDAFWLLWAEDSFLIRFPGALALSSYWLMMSSGVGALKSETLHSC